MIVGTLVRPSDGRLALLRDPERVAALKAQRATVEGVEEADIGWDCRTVVALKVDGSWGPSAAWQEAE